MQFRSQSTTIHHLALQLGICGVVFAAGSCSGDPQPPAVERTSASVTPAVSVGTLPGSARVSRLGSANYSIPLVLPKGVRGFQPSLQVAYASGGDNGILGPGFALVGVDSAVSRCPANWLDDQERSGVAFDLSDRLCLDGARIFLHTGTHFANGAVYRQRRERFQRIQIEGDLADDGQFVVTDRDGTKHYYGGEVRSTMTNLGVDYAWFRVKSVDTFGNIIRYTYAEDAVGATTTDLRLSTITYAQGPGQLQHRVALFYENRPDIERGWRWGAPFVHEKRLEKIVATANNATVREYRFDYLISSGTDRGLLEEVTGCAADSVGVLTCFPPTHFDWSDAPASYTTFEAALPSVVPEAEDLRVSVVADFDADGSQEVLFYDGQWKVWFMNDGGATPVLDQTVTTPPIAAQLNGGSFPPSMAVLAPQGIDVDADPDAEVIVPHCNGPCISQMEPFTWTPPSWWGASTFPNDADIPFADALLVLDNVGNTTVELQQEGIHATLPSRIYMVAPQADADGDGRADLFVCAGESYGAATWHFLRGLKASVATFDTYDLGIDCSEYDRYEPPVDIDGDGAAEFLIGQAPNWLLDNTAAELFWIVEIPTAEIVSGTFQQTISNSPTYPWMTQSQLPVDLVERVLTYHCGLPQPGQGGGTWPDDGYILRDTRGPGRNRWADFNGDGFVDLLRFDIATPNGGLPAPGLGEDLTEIDTLCNYGTQSPTDSPLLRVWYSTGDDFGPSSLATAPSDILIPGLALTSSYDADIHEQVIGRLAMIQLADVDTNGTTDVVMADAACSNWSVARMLPDFDAVLDTNFSFAWDCSFWLPSNEPRVVLSTNLDFEQLAFVTVANGGPGVEGAYKRIKRNSEPLDYLLRVTNGILARTEFTYGEASSSITHHDYSPCDADHRCDLGAKWLVRQIRHDAGMPNAAIWHSKTYTYYDGRMGLGGGGFLGFQQIAMTKMDSDQGGLPLGMTRRYYNLDYHESLRDYPRAGIAYQEIVDGIYGDVDSSSGYSRDVVRTTRTTALEPSPGSIGHFAVKEYLQTARYTFESSACSSLIEPCHADEINTAAGTTPAHSVITDLYTADAYGAPLVEQHSSSDGWSETTTYSDHLYDDIAWILGMPRQVEVESTTPGGTSVIRTMTQDYDVTTRALTESTLEPEDSEYRIKSTYGYDGFGNMTLVEHANAASVTRSIGYQYDTATGVALEKLTNPLGLQTQVLVDPATGQLEATQPPDGTITEQVYDPFSRLAEQKLRTSYAGPTNGDDLTITWAWDGTAPGSVYRKDAERDSGAQTKTFFDRLTRPVRRCWLGMQDVHGAGSPLELPGTWVCQDTEYTTRGNVGRVSTPYYQGGTIDGWTVLQHDATGRLLHELTPENRSRTTRYGPTTVTTSNAAGESHTIGYDSLGRVRYTRDPLDTTVCYEYGPFNQVEVIRKNCFNPNGGALAGPSVTPVSVDYDRYGNVVSVFDPDIGTTAYTYTDGFRAPETETNANGEVVTYAYDALGRATSKIQPEGTTTWVWDTIEPGHLTSVTSYDGVQETFAYDPFMRLSSRTLVVQGDSYTIGFDYNGPFLSGIDYPQGVSVDYAYDSAGYLREIWTASLPQPIWQAREASLLGSLEEAGFANNTETRTVRDWDGFVTSSRTTYTGFGSQQLERFQYDWNNLGQLERRTDALSDQRQEFTYDELSRLVTTLTYDDGGRGPVQTLSESYVYDIFGNLTSKTGVGSYVYGYGAAGNRASTIGGVTYIWDDAGRLLVRGSESFDWTSTGMLREFNDGTTHRSHLYAEGDRRSRTYDLTSGTRTTFVGSLYNETVDGTETIHRFMIPSSNGVAAQLTREVTGGGTSDEWSFIHADHLGSPRLVTNGSGGIDREVLYGPFGSIRKGSNWSAEIGAPAMSSQHTRDFTGHEERLGQDLINMRARYYDARIGRFITSDSIVPNALSSQSFNRFAYVENNPLSFIDPTGHAPEGNGVPHYEFEPEEVIGDPVDTGEVSTYVFTDEEVTGDAYADRWSPLDEMDEATFEELTFLEGDQLELALDYFDAGPGGPYGDEPTPNGDPDQYPSWFLDYQRDYQESNVSHITRERIEGHPVRKAYEAGAIFTLEAIETVSGAKAVVGGLKLGKAFVLGVLKGKVPLPRLKSSPFGPKIATNVPKNGVPKDWSRTDVEDAILNYTESIRSRKAEWSHFNGIGGSARRQAGHAERIRLEEKFLESLKDALENFD